ncbi:hypothetical protein EDD85DRAFT_955159 [Armillaria nabsnona]|nr:hypothetical protein EDD85DRAFT_963179 [Armillaria nabsnona]KAK0235573.1 hypothetical protein EDD85DRAFT_955159 [Armillaria nabsnona]
MALWLKDPPKIKSFYFQPETRVMQMPLFATIFAIVFILTKAAPMPHVDEVECDSTLKRAVEARVVESQLPGLAICL